MLNPSCEALLALGRSLQRSNYHFTTITPLSHRRVLQRESLGPRTLRDIFGWNRAFTERDLTAQMLGYLRAAGALEVAGTLRSKVRFSTLGSQIFLHSGFPTQQADAVFLGPDTYRFAGIVRQVVESRPWRRAARILDIGAGSGAGGLYAASLMKEEGPQIVLTDINERALQFSTVNARLNEVPEVTIISSNLYASVEGMFDLIISNPPYLVDPQARTYRHGGGSYGEELSLRIAVDGIRTLAPGGCLLVYTGTAVVDGVDIFRRELLARLGPAARIIYREVDPDVFGEELEAPPYNSVDRIAVVAATIERA